jgi:hypothetical protein
MKAISKAISNENVIHEMITNHKDKAVEEIYTVILSAKAPKLSTRHRGEISYELGMDKDKVLAIRLTQNSSAGRFSRGSANNCGFMIYVLKHLELIGLKENTTFDYLVSDKLESKIKALITTIGCL